MTNTPNTGWIGVDLDGTLAQYNEQHSLAKIGSVIEPMLFRIQQWLDSGVEVRIFTARASEEELITTVKHWLQQIGLPDLTVTNRKDYDLLQIWDDRVIQLETNTAELITPKERINLSVSGWVGVELDGTLAHFDANSPDALNSIGEAIGLMRSRVQQWLMVGIDVRLFTARATNRDNIPSIKQWLTKHQLEKMKITCDKDFSMSQFWDDCGVHVVSNTGEVTGRIDQLVPDRKFF